MSATATSPDACPPAPRRVRLADPAATGALGAAIGCALAAGDIVLLSGPLGAGKSALARAAVRAALGEPEREVPSPSYTLVNIHAGALGPEIWHVDLYRLSGPEEAVELGLEEAGALLIEWPDRLGDPPPRHMGVALSPTPDDARCAEIGFAGPG